MTETVNRSREENIDFIRGFGIVAVLIGHAIYFLMGKGIISIERGRIFYFLIYSFHMPLFFAISGYVSCIKREKTLSRQLLKDFLNLYIPFLFLNVFYYIERVVAFSAGVQLDTNPDVSLKGLIELLYVPHGESWFLFSLLIVKLISDILLHFTNLAVTFVVFALLFAASCPETLGPYIEYAGWGIYYMLGCVSFKCKRNLLNRKPVVCAGSLISIICGFLILFKLGELTSYTKLFVGSGVYLLMLVLTDRMKRVPFFNTFGENSMMIYVVHGFIQFPVYFLLHSFTDNPVLLFVLLLVVQWVILWIVWLLMTKTAALGWLKFIFHPAKLLKSDK